MPRVTPNDRRRSSDRLFEATSDIQAPHIEVVVYASLDLGLLAEKAELDVDKLRAHFAKPSRVYNGWPESVNALVVDTTLLHLPLSAVKTAISTEAVDGIEFVPNIFLWVSAAHDARSTFRILRTHFISGALRWL